MKILFFLIIFFSFVSCSVNKKVYWCGDHACINKKEKEAYFKKTMVVEVKTKYHKSTKNDTDLELIRQQVLSGEKKRIIKEKDLAKQIKYEKKRRIKEEKELAKQIRIEEKLRIKEEKKLSKVSKFEKKQPAKNTTVTNNQVISEEAKSIKFNELVEKIIKKNSFRPYPDINDIPN